MGFTRAFRNLQGKFFDYDCNVQLSTAIQLFVISASTTQSLFSTLNCGSNFQPRFSFSTLSCDSNFQPRSRFSTLSCDSNFQPRFSFSTLKCDCNFQLRLQLSSAIQLFNAQVRLQLSTTIRLFNAHCDSNFQVRGTFSTPDSDYYRSILLMVKKLLMVNKISMIFKTINVNY